jgi:hypothetical protein
MTDDPNAGETPVAATPPNPLAHLMTDDQDPDQVARIYDKVSQLLTRGEQVTYIAVQKPITFDPTPEIVVLTNRRFIHYRQNLLGQAQFTDYIWRDLKEARLEENVMRSTLTLHAINGDTLRVDNLVKAQARRLYAIAQEMEEHVREEMRLRQMEEKRAEAGGIYMPGTMGAPSAGTAAPADEPLQALSKLKQLMEAGLITADEFEAKKKEILARL